MYHLALRKRAVWRSKAGRLRLPKGRFRTPNDMYFKLTEYQHFAKTAKSYVRFE